MSEEKTFRSGEVMSMLEQMNDGIKVIGEQHEEIVKRFDGMDNRLDGIDNRLDGMDKRFDGIDNRLDGMDKRFDGIDKKLDGMQGDITEIKHKLSEKVDLKDFQNLEKRVIKLEKLILSKAV